MQHTSASPAPQRTAVLRAGELMSSDEHVLSGMQRMVVNVCRAWSCQQPLFNISKQK